MEEGNFCFNFSQNDILMRSTSGVKLVDADYRATQIGSSGHAEVPRRRCLRSDLLLRKQSKFGAKKGPRLSREGGYLINEAHFIRYMHGESSGLSLIDIKECKLKRKKGTTESR